MQNDQPSLIARDDTFLGVCEGLGEDFGFNPFFLRVALGVALLWNPIVVVGGYLAAGSVVALSRWLVPNPRPAFAGQPGDANEVVLAQPVAEQAAPRDNDEPAADPLAVAA